MQRGLCISVLISFVVIWLGGCWMSARQASSTPVRALVLTGGHDFDGPQFHALFNSFETITVTFAELDEQGRFFENIDNGSYDVIIFYHFRMPISQAAQKNLIALTQNGVGMVILHHALAGFPDWPEWRKIAGATYFLADTQEEGITWKRCTYQHDVELTVHIADTHHPVTNGLDDFQILDETYKGYRLEAGNHLLLTADHPLSQTEIGWTRRYQNANVCSIQPGHGKDAYENPAYRTLLHQAIRWCATGPKK